MENNRNLNNKNPGSRIPNNRQPDSRIPDSRQPDGRQPDRQNPDSRQPGRQNPDSRQSDRQNPGNRQTDRQNPGNRQTDRQNPGNRQTNSTPQNDWVNNPALKNVDAAKLQMLLSMAEQGKGLSQKELLPFLMTAASNSRSNGTSFSNDETELILNVLKQGKSPEEIARIDKVRSLVQMMKAR